MADNPCLRSSNNSDVPLALHRFCSHLPNIDIPTKLHIVRATCSKRPRYTCKFPILTGPSGRIVNFYARRNDANGNAMFAFWVEKPFALVVRSSECHDGTCRKCGNDIEPDTEQAE
jgi:hypothetical protein